MSTIDVTTLAKTSAAFQAARTDRRAKALALVAALTDLGVDLPGRPGKPSPVPSEPPADLNAMAAACAAANATFWSAQVAYNEARTAHNAALAAAGVVGSPEDAPVVRIVRGGPKQVQGAEPKQAQRVRSTRRQLRAMQAAAAAASTDPSGRDSR